MAGSIIHLHPPIFFHAKVGMGEWRKLGDVKRDVDKMKYGEKEVCVEWSMYLKGEDRCKERMDEKGKYV